MTNGAEIKTKEEIADLYKSNPGLAVGILFENVIEIKKNCSCRIEQCKKDQEVFKKEITERINNELKPKRIKNFLMQFPGGALGGAVAAYFIIEFLMNHLIK